MHVRARETREFGICSVFLYEFSWGLLVKGNQSWGISKSDSAPTEGEADVPSLLAPSCLLSAPLGGQPPSHCVPRQVSYFLSAPISQTRHLDWIWFYKHVLYCMAGRREKRSEQTKARINVQRQCSSAEACSSPPAKGLRSTTEAQDLVFLLWNLLTKYPCSQDRLDLKH